MILSLLRSRRPIWVLAALAIALLVAVGAHEGEASEAQSSTDIVGMFNQVKRSVAPACGCEVKGDELRRFTADLNAAESLEAAQAKALKQSELAQRAMNLAARFGPLDDSVRPAKERLDAFEARVKAATSQSQVAQAFEGLVSVDDGPLKEVKRKGRCSFTGTQVVIIIIGFILGILPGIIFLIIFC